MTCKEKVKLKLNILKEFKHLHYSLVEVLDIFKELERDVSNLAVEQELKRMKFKREKIK